MTYPIGHCVSGASDAFLLASSDFSAYPLDILPPVGAAVLVVLARCSGREAAADYCAQLVRQQRRGSWRKFADCDANASRSHGACSTERGQHGGVIAGADLRLNVARNRL